MENPFNTVLDRLERIEALQAEILKRTGVTAKDADTVEINEASRITGLATGTIRNLASQKRIPCWRRKDGKALQFSRKKLEAWNLERG